MDHEYDPNEGMHDVPEPEALPTADALAAICDLISTYGPAERLYESERPDGFCYQPWDNDIAINFQGSEFILSLRPSNYLRSQS